MLVGTLETPAQPVELKLHVFCIWTSASPWTISQSTTPLSPPVNPVKTTATVNAAAA